MEKNWKGKLAVITGASSGIGREIALKLASVGINLLLLGGNRIDNLNETKKLAQNYGVKVDVIPGDLTNKDWLTTSIQTINSKYLVDILINNAGVAQNCEFSKVTEEEYDKIMNINVKAPYFITQGLLENIRKSNYSTIINISSIVGHLGYPMQSVYSASKHALLGFTKTLASEEYKNGVRVHAICPGGVYTDMVKLSRPDLTADCMTLPEDIAEIVWFFLYMRGNAVVDEIIVHRASKEPFLV